VNHLLKVLIAVLSLSSAVLAESKLIVFFGDSLTAGLGLSEDDSYPGLIQKRLESEGFGGLYTVLNSGVSGDTTAAGLRRLSWALRNRPEIFFLALGANDGLRGVNPAETEKNLRRILRVVKEKYSSTTLILAGIDLPTNLGEDYRSSIREIFPRVAREEGAILMPFLLQGVAAVRELNQPDGIHPNIEGQKIIAKNVWEVLKPLLSK
jgi:acyl-CoA thioesterase-1